MVPVLGAVSPPTDHICPIALRELGTTNLDEPQDRVTPNVYYFTTVPICLCWRWTYGEKDWLAFWDNSALQMFWSAVTFPYVYLVTLQLLESLPLFKKTCTYFKSLCTNACECVLAQESTMDSEPQSGNTGNLRIFQEMQMLVSGATQRNIKPHNMLWGVTLAGTGTKSSLATAAYSILGTNLSSLKYEEAAL